jgi:LysM repeat protein
MSYTVRQNDTLSALARRFHTTVDAIAQANGIANKNLIRTGQRLNIPGASDDYTQSTSQRVPSGPPAQQSDQTMQHRSIGSELLRHPLQAASDALRSITGKPFDGEAAPATGNLSTVNTHTPFMVQQTPTGCFDTASAMARARGGTVSAPGNRVQVATHRSADAHVTVSPAGVQAGRARIDAALDANHPIVVGVTHPGGRHPNVDHITDHFVTVTGRGVDENGRQYYTINDPATRFGADTSSRNRMYVDPQTGNLYRPSNALPGFAGYRYELSMVR